ncbi:MAG TPA: Coq4 family protein [Myxococcota bacterium]|nr:Coq4 family protein [Myxococcota bacterium]
MNLKKMIEMVRAFRTGAPLGDVVVLKLDAFSGVSKEVSRKLEALRGYAPEQNLPVLRELRAGTLGREYARHLDLNGLEPLVISPHVKERFRDNPYVLRYTTTHDLHHVLTGFDTGLAGEAGLIAFNVGQGSAPVGRAMLWVARVVYSILSPSQAREIWHNVRVGLELGEHAELVIAQPIECFFEEPLAQVRAKLGIPDPGKAGVLPSRSSILGDILYSRKKVA